MQAHIQALDDMIVRTERSWAKFKEGTSHYTLQKNRLNALKIAKAILEDDVDAISKEQLQKAIAPIDSLLKKSEKAITKLSEDSWQYKMLARNIAALQLVAPMIDEAAHWL